MNANLANYPKGFAGGLTVRGMPVLNSHGREVFWVDSNGSTNDNTGRFERPFATIDAAINACTANKGSLIMVMPGHAETLVAAGAITHDTAGVSIVGLGTGNNRPVLTFTPAAASTSNVSWTGNNCSMENIVCIAGLDALTKPFSISGSGAYLDVEWQDGSSAIEAETVVLTTTAADNIEIKLTYRGFPAGDACVAPIKLNGCTDGRIFLDFYGKASTAVVNFVTTLSTNVLVTGYAYNSGDTTGAKLVVDTIGSSLWFAYIYAGAAGQVYKGGSAAAIAGDPTISAVTDALYGANGVASWPAEAAAANAVSIAEVLLYIQNAVRRGSGTSLAANKSIADALGTDGSTVTDSAVTVLGAIGANSNNNSYDSSSVVVNRDGSVLERLEDLQDGTKTSKKAAATLVNGATAFTIAGGPILIEELIAVCVTANNCVASTLQFSADGTDGSATTITGASASLASVGAGTIVAAVPGTLATAPAVYANGVGVAGTVGIIVPAGVITIVVGVGSTTGTWSLHIRYKSLAPGVTVT